MWTVATPRMLMIQYFSKCFLSLIMESLFGSFLLFCLMLIGEFNAEIIAGLAGASEPYIFDAVVRDRKSNYCGDHEYHKIKDIVKATFHIDMDMDTLELNDEVQLEEIINIVKNHIKKIVKTVMFNNVHDIVSFYKGYKKSGENSLEAFYKTYDIGAQINYGTFTSQCLLLMKHLWKEKSEHYSNISQSMFLGASYLWEPESFLKELNTGKLFSHSIGVLKFSVKNDQGFLVLDPSLKISIVPVIMLNRNSPLHSGCIKFARKKYEFMIYENNANYIYTRPCSDESDSVYNIEIETGEDADRNNRNADTPTDTSRGQSNANDRNDKDGIKIPIIIFVGKPYNLYLDTTQRYQLLSENKRTVLMRNKKRKPIYIFNFTMEHVHKDENWSFELYILDEQTQKLNKHELSYSNRLRKIENLGEDQKVIIQALFSSLRSFDKLLFDIGEILADEDFLNERKALVDKYEHYS